MAHLGNLLTATASLAVAQALVKGLELVLDDNQKLAFQGAADRLTLWLIEADPIRHYERLSEKAIQLKWLVAVVLYMWSATIIIAMRAGVSIFSDYRIWAYTLATPVIIYFPFRLTLSWLARSKHAWTMLLKAATPLLISFGAIWILRQYGDWSPPDIVTRIFWLTTISLFYGSNIVLLLYVAQATVWVFRHLMWRIATNAKGAWSATLFAVAAVLGVAATLVDKFR